MAWENTLSLGEQQRIGMASGSFSFLLKCGAVSEK
jgi:hypothetical protein